MTRSRPARIARSFPAPDSGVGRRLSRWCAVTTLAFWALAGVPSLLAADTNNASPVCRIMCVGDSITAGSDSFSCYRYPLREKLSAAGYVVEFVGTRSSPGRLGPLPHEGYGGKTVEYLAATVPANFRAHPADVVLLHAGHNHSVEENPVPSQLAATESLIRSFRTVNPRVIVLLAQVIPSGKLPKYSYLPQLNQGLQKLAERLNTPAQPVLLVDQSAGFDWTADTVADKVHPNARGAEKMAARWFETLVRVLPKNKPPKPPEAAATGTVLFFAPFAPSA